MLTLAQPPQDELATRRVPTPADIEALEAVLLRSDDKIECPLNHSFAPGVYLRQIFMPKGAFIIGHQHKTEHFNIVLCGRARVFMGGEVHEIVGPCTFKSDTAVRKILLIEEDMIWATVHPTHETDLEKLKAELITESPSHVEYLQEVLATLRLAAQPV